MTLHCNFIKQISTICLHEELINIYKTQYRCFKCDVTYIQNEVRELLKQGVMVFNATFNNISVILWWSVLLVEETEVPGEKNRPVASH